MTDSFRLTMAQLNPTVGDIPGNAEKAFQAWEQGRAAGSDMVALPEMFVTGYQTQDLVRRPAFYAEAMEMVETLAGRCADGPALAVGAPYFDEQDGNLYNAYSVLKGGKVQARMLKYFLPNFTVFDEVRLFKSNGISGPFTLQNDGPRLGCPICEDAWYVDVCETMVESGAEILVVPNGSPYFRNKFDIRMSTMVARVVENDVPLVYLNMVGGQDDQVFDGGSFVLNPGGELAAQLPVFDETLVEVDFTRTDEGWRADPGARATFPDEWEQDYRVMVEGLRDYMAKTGFTKVLLGLSGGIDSAIVATIAADALGPENVRGVMLPSEYTSQASLDDAQGVVDALGCTYDTVSIAAARQAVTQSLAPLFEGLEEGLTEENIQSRLRGVLLMAQSNKFGEMLLTTGNKSEVAVGYATIYGDMAGGYNPIKDMYKMRVFETCRWRNVNHRSWMKGPAGAVIPETIITKPPTAELRPDQRDDQSLPPYEVLDDILEMLVDDEATIADCVAKGHDLETVQKIERLILISEYKRFQSAPGPRLTPRAFWLDRRYPIVNRWRDKTGG